MQLLHLQKKAWKNSVLPGFEPKTFEERNK